MSTDVSTAHSKIATYGTNLKSSERELSQYGKSNAAKANDLVITNPIAKNAARIYRESIVGQKLKLQLRPLFSQLGISQDASDELAETVENEFDLYANSISFDADASRKQSFTGLLRTMATTRFLVGQAFAIVEWKKGQLGYYTCLNLIDPARVCNPNQKPNTQNLKNGIVLDNEGAAVGYWVRSQHPNDLHYRGSVTWKYISRYTKHGRPLMLHCYDVERPEQFSGISRFSSTASTMKKVSVYNDAELDRALLQSMFGAYIKSTLDYEDAMKVVGGDDDEENQIEKLNAVAMNAAISYYAETKKIGGASLLHLLPNEELGLIQPEQSVDAYEAFNKIAIREMAAGYGLDPHSLSKNYSDVSYSATRAAAEDAWRSYLTERQDVIDQVAMPVVSCFLEEAVDAKRIILPKGIVGGFYRNKQALCRGDFMGWSKPNIDPVKTAKSNEIDLKNGLVSRSEICANRGVDFRDVVDSIARDKKYAERKGVKPEDFNPELLFNLNNEKSNPAENKTNKDDEDEDDE